MLLRLTQSIKAASSIFFTLSGILTLSRLVQLANALSSITVTPAGISTLPREKQLLKSFELIAVIFFDSVTLSSFSQHLNAP